MNQHIHLLCFSLWVSSSIFVAVESQEPAAPVSVTLYELQIRNFVGITVVRGNTSVTEFKFQVQELNTTGVWIDKGPEDVEQAHADDFYVVRTILTPGNAYRAKAQAVYNGIASNVTISNTIYLAPSPPTAVTLTEVPGDTTQLRVTIGRGLGNVEQYSIQIRELTPGAGWSESGPVQIVDVRDDDIYNLAISVVPGVRYQASVMAVSNNVTSSSVTSSFLDIAPSTPVSILLSSESSNSSQLIVSITPGPGVVAVYNIEIDESVMSGPWQLVTIVQVAPNADNMYAVDISVTPGNSYRANVTAMSNDVISGATLSNELHVRPSSPVLVVISTIPSMPDQLKVVVTRGLGSVEYFDIRIEESDSSGVWVNIGTAQMPPTADDTYYINATLVPGNNYRATVLSHSNGLDSNPRTESNVIAIPPSPPASVELTEISGDFTRLNVTITPGEGTVTQFIIQIEESYDMNEWHTDAYVTSNPSVGGVYTVSVDVIPGASYRVVVTSVSGTVNSTTSTTSDVLRIPPLEPSSVFIFLINNQLYAKIAINVGGQNTLVTQFSIRLQEMTINGNWNDLDPVYMKNVTSDNFTLDATITPGTSYRIMVKSVNNGIYSTGATTSNVVTLQPSKPVSVAISLVPDDPNILQVMVYWDRGIVSRFSFQVQKYNANGTWKDVGTNTIQQVSPQDIYYIDISFLPLVKYRVVVTSLSNGEMSRNSTISNTIRCPPAPPQDVSLFFDSGYDDLLIVSVSPNNVTGTQYKIQLQIFDDGAWINREQEVVDVTVAGIYNISVDLDPGSEYRAKVKSVFKDVESVTWTISNQIVIAPSPPAYVCLTEIPGDQSMLLVNVTKGPGRVSHYDIQLQILTQTGFSDVEVYRRSVTYNSIYYLPTDVQPGSTYRVLVTAMFYGVNSVSATTGDYTVLVLHGQCNINETASFSCLNNGTCSDVSNSTHVCTCGQHFGGYTCEYAAIDGQCPESHACHNAACSNISPVQYTCLCPIAFVGFRCEIDTRNVIVRSSATKKMSTASMLFSVMFLYLFVN